MTDEEPRGEAAKAYRWRREVENGWPPEPVAEPWDEAVKWWGKPVADRVRGPMEIRDRPVHAAFAAAVERAEYEQSPEARIAELLEENRQLRELVAKQLQATLQVDLFCREWLGVE